MKMDNLKEMLKYSKRQKEFMILLYQEIKYLPREVQLELISDFKKRINNL